MNRPLLITIGITILLLVLGVWVYLMLFGAPENTGEVFTNLGFSPTQQATTVTPPVDTPPIESLVDTTTGQLRQLTTRAVAGFIATTTPAGDFIRYAERGTGHIYQIELKTGKETLISRTTVPQVAEAVFSGNATMVALTSYQNYTTNVSVGTIKDGEMTGITLEPGARNLAFQGSNVLYSIVRNGTTHGYRQNLTNEVRSEIFSFAFANLDVAWNGPEGRIYLTTKPARTLPGYTYTISGTTVTPVLPSQPMLTTIIGSDAIVASGGGGDTYQSVIVKNGSSTTTPLPLSILREKCAFDNSSQNHLWCASPAGSLSADFVNNWYKGEVASEDYLWLVNLEQQTASMLASPKKELGRSLDIVTLTQNSTGSMLLFKNRDDQTLWLFDLTAE